MPEIASARLSIRPDLLPSGPAARVLDVGCGDGRHIAAATRRGCRAIGIDYDAGELAKARLRAGARRADLIAADAARLPFRAAAFDAVICTETLEHLPDDRGALAEMARVLRPGGLLHGAVPSHFTEAVYWALSPGYRNAPGGHVRIYRPRDLLARLQVAGFRLLDLRYVHFVDSLIWLRFCLTDYLRPRAKRAATPYEAAILLAVAQQQSVPAWRTRLRAALPRSRLIALADAAGACIWPKSATFVARKPRG